MYKNKLTIGIPTYNRAQYIDKLLNEIISTCEEQNVEILVSDNYSNDDTPIILKKYSDKKNLKITRNSSNLGFDGNILKLFENASGNFLWLLGDDDCIDIKRIGQILELIDQYPETGIFYADFCINKISLKNFSEKMNFYKITQQEYVNNYLHQATLISTNIFNLKYYKNLNIDNSFVGYGWIHLYILLKMVNYLNECSIYNIIIKNKVVMQRSENNNYNFKKYETLFIDNFMFIIKENTSMKINYEKFIKNFYKLNIKLRFLKMAKEIPSDKLIKYYKKISFIYNISLKDHFLFWIYTFFMYIIGIENIKKYKDIIFKNENNSQNKYKFLTFDGYTYKRNFALISVRIIDFLLNFALTKKRIIPQKIKKILIIKSDHMGDMLIFTSVLPIMKKFFSKASIDIICGKWSLPILENNPYIEKKYVVNHIAQNREKKIFIIKLFDFIYTYIKSLIEIIRQSYDICLIMRPYNNNLLTLALLSNSKYIVGHKLVGFSPLFDKCVEYIEGTHESGHFIEILKPFRIENEAFNNIKYQLYPVSQDYDYVRNIIKNSFKNPQKIAIIHPGTGDFQRMISNNIWIEIIKYLENMGYEVAITGTKNEKIIAEKIASKNSIILCGTFSVNQLFIFFESSKIVITLESLAAHVAACSGTKVISLYSGITDTNQWRPLGKNVTILKNHVSCSPCFKNKCLKRDCMNFDIEEIKKSIKSNI